MKEVHVYFGSETGAEAGEAEVRELIEATVRACQAKDKAALMDCYAPSVLAFDLITPLSYEGAAQVGKRAGEWFDSFEGKIGYEVRDLEIMAGAEVAFCYGLNHVIGTTKAGQPLDMWWRSTLGCRKLEGKWLITHAHSSVPFDMVSGQAVMDLKP